MAAKSKWSQSSVIGYYGYITARHCQKKVTLLQSRRKRGDSILSTEWIENLLEKIRDHIETRKYRITEHAISQQNLRSLKLPDIVEALHNGFHEKSKTLFSNKFQTWKYAIRGKAVDGGDVRVIIAFEEDMIIITAIRLPRRRKK